MKNDHRANGKNEAFVNPHHLPEAVVAISDLSRGSVKFNPISAIKSFLSKVPELRDAIDNGGIPMFPPWKSHKAARAYEEALLGHLLTAAQDARASRALQ